MTIALTTLTNGVRVVVDHYRSELATVCVLVEVGTRFEPHELNGLAHFLEHMAFKGTTTRDAQKIAADIESRGGHINAGTGKDVTKYFATVLREDADLALEILSDIVLNSTLPADELERERGVILQERRDLEDDPMAWLGEQIMAYGFRGGLGLPGLGTPDTLARVTVPHLRRFIDTHYRPDTIIVAAAGGIDPDVFTRQSEDLFGGMVAGTLPRYGSYSVYGGGRFSKESTSEQVHVRLAFPSFPLGHPDLYPAAVLSKMVGGCSMSPLWQELREMRGLCYHVGTNGQAWREAGLELAAMSCGPDEAPEAIERLCEVLKRSSGGLTDEQLAIGKKLCHAELVMALETSYDRLSAAQHHFAIHGKAYDLQEEIERFNEVDHDAINRVIERQLSQPPTIAIMGPQKVLDIDIERMLRP